MNSRFKRFLLGATMLSAVALGAVLPASDAQAWEPSKTIEFIVPAGSGGGADQMARLIQGIIQKHKLAPVSMVVINKSGGAGAEGFMDVKSSEGNEHKIIITLSNLFTTPRATGTPFSWKDFTPVAMMALDEFVLWVKADTPYKTAKDYVAAVKKGDEHAFKMGGTGSKQEDQIITVAIEQSTGVKFTYVPFKGGGTVAKNVVGGHINSSVNNPIEQVSFWKAGETRALCIFDEKRSTYKEPISKDGKSWADIPTCREAGIDMDYLMLRGIFMPGGVDKDVVTYYVDLMKKVRETPEWKDFMEKGAYNQTFMSGDEYKQWVTKADALHAELMEKAGFIKK